MGWLQGRRYQNKQQYQAGRSGLGARDLHKPKAEVFQVEHVESQRGTAEILDAGKHDEDIPRKAHRGEDAVIWPFHDEDKADNDLPFIPKEEVMAKRAQTQCQVNQETLPRDESLWIVVDNIVYDCSSFVHDHPGGQQVIRSFVGEDCSWQFWRFHGKNEMDRYGRALRVGRTSGVQNRFPEAPRYVGLSKIGHDEW